MSLQCIFYAEAEQQEKRHANLGRGLGGRGEASRTIQQTNGPSQFINVHWRNSFSAWNRPARIGRVVQPGQYGDRKIKASVGPATAEYYPPLSWSIIAGPSHEQGRAKRHFIA
jgi:hypothetical protein